jgi:hypothetical protein
LEDRSSFEGKIAENGGLTVNSVILDKLFLNKEIAPPDVVKIDVEGGEFDVLRGMKKILADCRPKIFLAVHSPQQSELCLNFLSSLGYSVNPLFSGKNSELMAELKKN